MKSKFYKIVRNRHFQQGVPFLIAMLVGSYGLQVYSQIKYDALNERYTWTKTKELKDLIGDKSQSKSKVAIFSTT